MNRWEAPEKNGTRSQPKVKLGRAETDLHESIVRLVACLVVRRDQQVQEKVDTGLVVSMGKRLVHFTVTYPDLGQAVSDEVLH